MGTRIPSLRGELGLLPSLWLDVSSFWEVDCKEATFVGGIDWDARGPGWESCFVLLEEETRQAPWDCRGKDWYGPFDAKGIF